MLPARRSDLVIERLEDESVVYDPVRYRAHCLNQTARLVLEACNGKASLGQIAAQVRGELKVPISGDVVRSALEKLSSAHLLEQRFPRSPRSHAVSRRKLIAAGVGAVVVSMAVPSAAFAVSGSTCFHGAGANCGCGSPETCFYVSGSSGPCTCRRSATTGKIHCTQC